MRPLTPGERACVVILLAMLAAVVGVTLGVWLDHR